MRRRRLRLGRLDPLDLDADTAERLLDGRIDPADAPPGYGGVAELLAAAAGPATVSELSGEQAAVAALVAVAHPSDTTRRASMLSSLLRAKLVAVLATAMISAGGVAAAATGNLPAPIQQLAHQTLNAPAAHQHAGPQSRHHSDQGRPATDPAKNGKGPDATGPARHGLCQAYQAGQGSTSGHKLDAVAFQALSKAAGGVGKVGAYCGAVSPGKAADHKPPATHKHPGADHGRGQAVDRHRSRSDADGNPAGKTHRQTR